MNATLPVDLAILIAETTAAGFGRPEREWGFHPTRFWRFDLAWPALLVAFEREGMGGHSRSGVGRHQTKAGYREDCHKYNAAALAGWMLIRGTAGMLKDGTAARDLIAALEQRRDGNGGTATVAKLYEPCPVCRGTRKTVAPMMVDGYRDPDPLVGPYSGPLPVGSDCPCLASSTPGFAETGLTTGYVERLEADRMDYVFAEIDRLRLAAGKDGVG